MPKHHFALIHCFLDHFHTEIKKSNVEGVGEETKKKGKQRVLEEEKEKEDEGKVLYYTAHAVLSISGKSIV